MSRKLGTQVANGIKSNGLDLFSWIRGIVEQGLGRLFITSNGSRFFNKSDLGQCLFQWLEVKPKSTKIHLKTT